MEKFRNKVCMVSFEIANDLFIQWDSGESIQ